MKNIFSSPKANILVIGDVMLDRYLGGFVERISPEAPVPIVVLESDESRLGGAANVALNLQHLGAYPVLVSAVGEDSGADQLGTLLTGVGNETGVVLRYASRKTTVKTRVLAKHQQLLRFDDEITHNLAPEEEDELINAVAYLLKRDPYKAIIFQDYNKGVLTPKLISAVLALADTYSVPTVVDPKLHNFFAYKGVTLFKPNLREINTALDANFSPNLEDLREADRQLRSRLQHRYTLITLGEKGLFFADDQGHAEIIPAHTRQIADVCGAGDTVVSVAAWALAANCTLPEIAALSNLAGGIVCEYAGVVPIDKNRLEREWLA